MMRIAMDLTDDDVVVLKALQIAMDKHVSTGAGVLNLPSIEGITPDSVLSICGKLQSVGLIAVPEQRAKTLRVGTYPSGGGFMPLERAEKFLNFISVGGRR
jgi:hypothetical protein